MTDEGGSITGHPTGHPERDQAALAEAAWGERHTDISKRLGEVTRLVCLGGYAAIWILKGAGQPPGAGLPALMVVAALCFTAALTVDLLHGLLNAWIAYHALQLAARRGRHPSWEEKLATKAYRLNLLNYAFLGKILLVLAGLCGVMWSGAGALVAR